MTTQFAMPNILRDQPTCEPTPMLRWRRNAVQLGHSNYIERTLEQLCIVKDYDQHGNVTDIRQEWREVPTEDGP